MKKIQVVKFLAKRMGENIEREASLNSIINILSIILLIGPPLLPSCKLEQN